MKRISEAMWAVATIGGLTLMFLCSMSGYALTQSANPAEQSESAEPTPAGALSQASVAASVEPPLTAQSVSDQGASIGEQAGLAVRDFNKTSAETYQAFNQEKEKKIAEFRTMTDDAMKTFQTHMDKSMKDFDAMMQRIQSSLKREADKFRQTVNAPPTNGVPVKDQSQTS